MLKGLKQRIDETALKRVQQHGRYKFLLILDNVQELEVYLHEKEKKKQFFELYHQIKELNDDGLVNIVTVSYDSVFFSELTKEMRES